MYSQKVGGLADALEPDDEVRKVVSEVREEVEKQTGHGFETLEVLKYRVQVVAGKNYFVKVGSVDFRK